MRVGSTQQNVVVSPQASAASPAIQKMRKKARFQACSLNLAPHQPTIATERGRHSSENMATTSPSAMDHVSKKPKLADGEDAMDVDDKEETARSPRWRSTTRRT